MKKVLILVVLLFAGCATKNIVKMPDVSDIIGDKNKAETEKRIEESINKLDWITLETVYFDFDSVQLKYWKRLKDSLEKILSNSDLEVMVVGHACHIGDEEYNISLGEHRARAVYQYLAVRGIPENRLYIDTMGESEPAGTLEKSRRVEIKVR